MKSHRVVVDPILLGDLPFRVLTQAFWRPQAFSPTDAERQAVERTVDVVARRWRAEESWVNHSLDTILGAMPPALIATLMRDLMPEVADKSLVPSTCHGHALNPYIGEPDVFLVGEKQAVACEIKIGAKRNNGRYSFEQFTKYLTLMMLLQASRRNDLPRDMCHLLVVPTLDPSLFCGDYRAWSPSLTEGYLQIDPSRVLYVDRKGRFDDYQGWRTVVLEPLRKVTYALANEFDSTAVDEIERDLCLSSMKVRVVTWSDLMNRIANLCESNGLGHLSASCELVAELGTGRG